MKAKFSGSANVVLTVLTTLLASACGSQVKDVRQRIEEPQLMDTWEGKCAKSDLLNLSAKPRFKFSGNSYQEVHTFYSDADCVSQAVNITYKGELTLKETSAEQIRKVDFRFDHVEVAALNDAGKGVLDTVAFCGVKAWEVNKPLNLDGKTGTVACPLRTVPTGEFNIFAVKEGVLYLGKTGLRGGAAAEASRPTALETESPFTRASKNL